MNLIERRRGMGTFKESKVLYELHQGDIDENKGLMPTAPNYYSINRQRISYVKFDLFLDGGKTYIFEVETNDATQRFKIGAQYHTTLALQQVENGLDFTKQSAVYDTGWQDSPLISTPPTSWNGYDIKGVRLTFRLDPASNINQFRITKVTIKEVQLT